MPRQKSIPKKSTTVNDENESLNTTETSSQKQTETPVPEKSTDQESETQVGQDSADVPVETADAEKANSKKAKAATDKQVEDEVKHEPLIQNPKAPTLVNGETKEENEKRLAPYRHPKVTFPEGRILTPEMPDSVTGEEVTGGILLDIDTYRVIIPHNSKRPIFTLLYRKGMVVPATNLQQIG